MNQVTPEKVKQPRIFSISLPQLYQGISSRVLTVEEAQSQNKPQHSGQAQRPPLNTRVYGWSHQPGLFPHILPVIRKTLLSLA